MAEAIFYNTLLNNLECVVCNEPICDPRALPCGHSYCGPPRTCLQSMESGLGARSVMKCAVCRANYYLRANQIKPLYGIKDLFPKVDTTSPRSFQDYIVNCATHAKLFTLWCKTCCVKICEDCLDTNHDEHSIKKLKRHLIEQLELKLEGEIVKKLEIRKKILQELSCQMKEIGVKCKTELKTLSAKVALGRVAEKHMLKELHVIEAYLDRDHQNVELETKLLLCLNDDLNSNADGSLSSTFVGQAKSVSCQTDCNNLSPKSVEKASQCVIEQKSKIFYSEVITLHVEQRNPLKVSTVKLNTDMWGFIFHITGTLAHCEEHKYSKGCKEKMFRISITNNQSNGPFFDTVVIKHEVRLLNWVDPTNTLSGVASAIGAPSGLSMRSSIPLILHPHLMNHCRNWVNQEDNLRVSIDLSAYKMDDQK